MAVELDSPALKNAVAFTGRLACMTRAEAFAVVRHMAECPAKRLPRARSCSSSASLVGLC